MNLGFARLLASAQLLAALGGGVAKAADVTPAFELVRTVRSSNWEEVTVSGPRFERFDAEGEPTGVTAPATGAGLLLLRGGRGIEEAHAAGALPTWARDELLAEDVERLIEPTFSGRCRRDDRQVYAVSREALEQISGLLASLPASARLDSAPSGLSFCGDKTKSFDARPSHVLLRSGSETVQRRGFEGVLDYRFDLGFNRERQPWTLALKIKRALCIPYAVYLKSATFDLAADVTLAATATGRFTGPTGKDEIEKEIASPEIFALTFFIGPIPVILPFDVPLSVGLEWSVDAPGTASFGAAAVADFRRAYECDGDDCKQTASDQGITFERSGELRFGDGHALAFVFAGAAVRASLYAPDVAAISLGLRAGVQAEGHFRSPAVGCGDADGDGREELVETRLIDYDARADLVARVNVWKYDAFFSTPLETDLHLALDELQLQPGSASAASPLLRGPELFQPGEAVIFQTALRPCWPWPDDARVRLAIQDRPCPGPDPVEVETVGGPRNLTPPLECRFGTGGLKMFTAEVRDDFHGRNLAGHVTARSALGNFAPIGFLDAAVDARDGDSTVPIGGRIAVSGWAFDPDGNPGAPVASVELGSATGGFVTSLDARAVATGRPDVVNQLERLDALWSGFGAVVSLYTARSGETTTIEARAFDREGGRGVLGTPRSIRIVKNDTIETPGEIDERDHGARYRGNTRRSGTTTDTDYRDDYTASCSGGAPGRDAVYRLTLPVPRRIRLTTAGSEFDTVLTVQRLVFDPELGLRLQELACDDDAGEGPTSELEVELPAGTFYVIVDGKETDSEGLFELFFELG